MDIGNEFYINGYHLAKFANSENIRNIKSIFKNILVGNLKEGFKMESKYDSTLDLRPDVFSYDSVFLSLLMENDIPNLLKKLGLFEYTLAHIQLRAVNASPKSYTGWHRDTHFYGGQVVGNIPPVFKIIYYPNLQKGKSAQLRIIPGSHLRIFQSSKADKL